jgi:membrane peptidoglycan carboxypeptidase
LPSRTRGTSRASRSGGRRRWIRALLWLVTAVALAVLFVVVVLLVLVLEAPSVANAPQKTAAILAAHGAPSDDGVLPAKVAAAVLATEDSRFYHDPALDPLGVARTGIGVVTSDGQEGGATIEQQLAKLLYSPGTSLGSELRQVGLAFRLDQKFSKKQILAMYLDAAYFGDGAYGVTAASEHYFGLPPGQLSWAQASLLAGLVQAPSEYDPHGHLDLAKSRQSHVLARLVATHVLSQATAAQTYAAPLDPAIRFYG